MPKTTTNSLRFAHARALMQAAAQTAVDTNQRYIVYECTNPDEAVSLRASCYEYRRIWRNEMERNSRDSAEFLRTMETAAINSVRITLIEHKLIFYFRHLPSDPPIAELIKSRMRIALNPTQATDLPAGAGLEIDQAVLDSVLPYRGTAERSQITPFPEEDDDANTSAA